MALVINRVCSVVRHSTYTATKGEWILANSLIDAYERDRIRQFQFKQDAKASLFAQLLIRKRLCELLSLRNEDLRIKRTRKGKPFAEFTKSNDAPATFEGFNIAHSDHFTVIASDSCGPIGVDLMKAEMSDKRFEEHRRRRKTMTDVEWKTIDSVKSLEEKKATFMRLWCLKEAYYKATGEGIFAGLRNLECSLEMQVASEQRTHFASQAHYFGTSMKRSGAELDDWYFEEICFVPESERGSAVMNFHNSHVVTLARRTTGSGRVELSLVDSISPTTLIQSVAKLGGADGQPKDVVYDTLWDEYAKKPEAQIRKSL